MSFVRRYLQFFGKSFLFLFYFFFMILKMAFKCLLMQTSNEFLIVFSFPCLISIEEEQRILFYSRIDQSLWLKFVQSIITGVLTINPSSGYFPKLLAFSQWPFKSLRCLQLVPLKFSIPQNQLSVENKITIMILVRM